MMRIETSRAIREIHAEFRQLVPGRSNSKFNQAIARALNRVAEQTRTQAKREIRIHYKIKAGDIAKHIAIRKAQPMDQTAAVMAFGRRIPLHAFSARQTAKGVTVNITGKRQLLPSAFIATMKSGHTGVFARGRYNNGEFEFRKKRIKRHGNDLPITELKTLSIPIAMANKAVLDALSQNIEEKFPDRLRHEMNFLLGKQGG